MGTTAAFVRADNDNGAAVSDVTPLAQVSIRTAVVRMYPAAQSVKEEAGRKVSVRARGTSRRFWDLSCPSSTASEPVAHLRKRSVGAKK